MKTNAEVPIASLPPLPTESDIPRLCGPRDDVVGSAEVTFNVISGPVALEMPW